MKLVIVTLVACLLFLLAYFVRKKVDKIEQAYKNIFRE